MKIECLLKRADGTIVTMAAPDRHYHFKPSETDPRHIAEVDVQHHAKALLRITEGYRAVDGDELEDDTATVLPFTLNGSSVHAASYKILGGDTILLGDLVRMAFEDSGLTVEQWNSQDDQDRNEYIDATLKELQEGYHGDAELAKLADQAKADETVKVSIDQLKQVNEANAQTASNHGDTASDAASSTKAVREDDTAQDAGNGDTDAQNQVDEPSTERADQSDLNGNGITDDLESLTRKELVPLYVERFGREPSSRMTVPDIKRALSEDDD